MGWVQDPGDIYSLTEEQLAQLPGFKEKKIQNLLTGIEASKDRPLWRLLVALNIRHVGSTVARLITEAFPSIDALMEATEEDIAGVEGVGPIIARSVVEWCDDEENRKLIEKLRKAGVRMEDEPPRFEAPDDPRFASPQRWRRGHPIEPRAMRLGEVVDAAVGLYRMHWRALLGFVAILVVPVQFLEQYLTRNYRHYVFGTLG